jgi:chromate transporter
MTDAPQPAYPPSSSRVPTGSAPTALQLFAAFAKIALSGFGGVIAWSRRILVQERGWLTPQEFNEVLALCQVLPGPNIVNVSVVLGARWAGLAGALAALFGLVGLPMVLMICAGELYRRYGGMPELRGLLGAIAAAAAGQIAATAVQIAEPMAKGRFRPSQLVAVVTFIVAGVLRLPLIWVMAATLPVAIGCAWWERGRS